MGTVNRPLSLLLLLLCMTCLVRSAMAADLYTVRLGLFPDLNEARTTAADSGAGHDLWVRKVDEGYALNAGIFPDPNHAELLRDHLTHGALSANVVATTTPADQEWLPWRQTITLRDLGHRSPVLLQGVEPYRSFHFTWDSTMRFQGSRLDLHLQVSRFLRPSSTITLLAENIPLASFSIAELRKNPDISVSLNSLQGQDVGRTLDVAISGTLSATEDHCADMLSRNLWLMVSPQSRLQVIRSTPPRSAGQFFTDPAARYTFATRPATRKNLEAMTRIAGLIGSQAGSSASRIRSTSYDPSGKNIFVEDFNKDILVLGSNLFITPAGARLIASRWLSALVFPELENTLRQDMPARAPLDISFQDLGLPHRTARGTGDLVFSVNFSPLQLGGWPDKLLCTIVYAHTPVNRTERCFLRIRMNGVLLESREIMGQGGQHSLVFAVPSRYIQENNNLEFAFSYYLNTGDCEGSYPDFEVSLFKDSFLTVTGFNPSPPLTLSTFPALFAGHGVLVISKKDPSLYRPAMRLVELLGFLQHRVPDISVTDPDAPGIATSTYGLLVLDAQEAETYRPPVDIAPRFRIKNPLTGRELVRFDTKDAATVVQTFYGNQGHRPLLLFDRRNITDFPDRELTQLLTSHARANVGIIHDHQWQALEVGKKYHIIYPDRHNLTYYWMRYRIIAFFVLGAAVLLFLLYLYHRLAREK